MLLYQPMRLLRVVKPFDDPDFVWEWKIDGFRGLAFIENGRCRLVSRNGHTFTQWDALTREIPRRCVVAPRCSTVKSLVSMKMAARTSTR